LRIIFLNAQVVDFEKRKSKTVWKSAKYKLCPSRKRTCHIISPVQFRNPMLALSVVSALGQSGLAASRLELEITESVLLQADRNADTCGASRDRLRIGSAVSSAGGVAFLSNKIARGAETNYPVYIANGGCGAWSYDNG
jgi:hypothetical protein